MVKIRNLLTLLLCHFQSVKLIRELLQLVTFLPFPQRIKTHNKFVIREVPKRLDLLLEALSLISQERDKLEVSIELWKRHAWNYLFLFVRFQ